MTSPPRISTTSSTELAFLFFLHNSSPRALFGARGTQCMLFMLVMRLEELIARNLAALIGINDAYLHHKHI